MLKSERIHTKLSQYFNVKVKEGIFDSILCISIPLTFKNETKDLYYLHNEQH